MTVIKFEQVGLGVELGYSDFFACRWPWVPFPTPGGWVVGGIKQGLGFMGAEELSLIPHFNTLGHQENPLPLKEVHPEKQGLIHRGLHSRVSLSKCHTHRFVPS